MRNALLFMMLGLLFCNKPRPPINPNDQGGVASLERKTPPASSAQNSPELAARSDSVNESQGSADRAAKQGSAAGSGRESVAAQREALGRRLMAAKEAELRRAREADAVQSRARVEQTRTQAEQVQAAANASEQDRAAAEAARAAAAGQQQAAQAEQPKAGAVAAEQDRAAAEAARAVAQAEQQAAQAKAAAIAAEQDRVTAEAARAAAAGQQQAAQAVASSGQANRSRSAAESARADGERAVIVSRKADSAHLQTEAEKTELRSRLLDQLNTILETRDSARGLIVNISDVLFDSNQTTLKPGAREKLAKVSGILLAYPGLKLAIEGHTDSIGSDQYNQTLSEKRAMSVRDYLIAQGVNMNNLTAMGMGKANPVASNDAAAGRQQNRRVEMVISGEAIGGPVH